MKTRLTREESQHLISLGVSKELASGIDTDNFDEMFLLAAEAKGNGNGDKTIRSLATPIFKLDDFLNEEILPREIGNRFCINISWDFLTQTWCVDYDYTEESFHLAEELIDALYELACWYYGEYLKSEYIKCKTDIEHFKKHYVRYNKEKM